MSFYEYGQTEEYLLSLVDNSGPPGPEDVAAEAEKFGAPIVSRTARSCLKRSCTRCAPAAFWK